MNSHKHTDTLASKHCLIFRYQDDFRPLVEGCCCYCCKKHMRAYVHHLLVTNELLGGVLLMLHNMAHYLGFFKALREAIASDCVQDFKNRVLHCREGYWNDWRTSRKKNERKNTYIRAYLQLWLWSMCFMNIKLDSDACALAMQNIRQKLLM